MQIPNLPQVGGQFVFVCGGKWFSVFIFLNPLLPTKANFKSCIAGWQAKPSHAWFFVPGAFDTTIRQMKFGGYWVAVKELIPHYYSGEAIFFTIYIYNIPIMKA